MLIRLKNGQIHVGYCLLSVQVSMVAGGGGGGGGNSKYVYTVDRNNPKICTL
jgi:hypothetical protein